MRRKLTVLALMASMFFTMVLPAEAVTFYDNGALVTPTGTKGLNGINCGTKKVYIKQYSFDFAWTDSMGTLQVRWDNDDNGLGYIATIYNREFDEAVYRFNTGHHDVSGITFSWSGLSGLFSTAQITRGCY